MSEITVSKSIIYDYFVLQKNNEIPFYFKKEDLDIVLEKLLKLKYELSATQQKITIYCYMCGEILLILDSNACYCDNCETLFTEEEIRNNCGI